MYLCDEIRDKNGYVYPMAGVLHQSATMENMKLRLGYRTLLYNETRLKGHEFHYSRPVEQQNPLPSCAVAYTAKGVETDTPLYHYKNVWAGYTHLYWVIRSETNGLPNLSSMAILEVCIQINKKDEKYIRVEEIKVVLGFMEASGWIKMISGSKRTGHWTR